MNYRIEDTFITDAERERLKTFLEKSIDFIRDEFPSMEIREYRPTVKRGINEPDTAPFEKPLKLFLWYLTRQTQVESELIERLKRKWSLNDDHIQEIDDEYEKLCERGL